MTTKTNLKIVIPDSCKVLIEIVSAGETRKNQMFQSLKRGGLTLSDKDSKGMFAVFNGTNNGVLFYVVSNNNFKKDTHQMVVNYSAIMMKERLDVTKTECYGCRLIDQNNCTAVAMESVLKKQNLTL